MNDDALTRSLVAATIARLDEALLPLRNLLSAAHPGEELATYYMRLHHQTSIRELRAHGFKTNDLLEIDPSIAGLLRKSQIKINGSPIELEIRELLLIFVLAQTARNSSVRSGIWSGSEEGFVTVATLLEEIDRAKAEANLGELWSNAIDTDVHKAVASLRQKIESSGFNRNLIESKRGSGYRLSTPVWNLINSSRTE